jgi:amino acid transporter
MFWKQLFARKSLEKLLAEMKGENRLRRALGPVGLTSLGVGAIIGAGIFVMTGRAAAVDAGPAIIVSYMVAGVGCALAALCYAEFASMVPVAGSAYTYSYATLGELLAWIIGWDLVLEYAMACACVASSWSKYFNEFLKGCLLPVVPEFLSHDPFSHSGAWFNLPAFLITLAVTAVLVIGIRESAWANAVLVAVKTGVVLFVILLGIFFVSSANWFTIPPKDRITPGQIAIPEVAENQVKAGTLTPEEADRRIREITNQVVSLRTLDGEGLEKGKAVVEKNLWAFYLETAKLPEDQRKLRINQLTAELLALYKVNQESDPELQKEALTKVFTKGIPTLAVKLSPTEPISKLPADKRTEALAALKAMQKAVLVDSVRIATAGLISAKQMTSGEALGLLDAGLTAYTRSLVAKKVLTPEEANDTTMELRAAYSAEPTPLPEEIAETQKLLKEVDKKGAEKAAEKWGILAYLGLNKALTGIDDSVRSPFLPYGLSGIMLGAAIVFFAFIGFDSISTHSEEAINPQRDVPIGILASLVICTVLYIAVAAVITGLEPFPEIDPDAAIAAAFRHKSEQLEGNFLLRASGVLIATGALAGMTSVLLITFLSQARIFLAMARDKLLPPAIFGAVHEKFKTPYISTMLTGGIISLVAAFTPITKLEEMVNIGTLMAFVVVCASVLLLRIRRPEAQRPFRTPLLFVVAPLGILVNFLMTLFLPLDTWLRLVVWLLVGLGIYFGYGMWKSDLRQDLRGELRPTS